MKRLKTLLQTIILINSVYARPYILFANKKDIHLVEVNKDNHKSPKTNVVVKNLSDAAALDFFLTDNTVCWTEMAPPVIKCSKINPTKKKRTNPVTIISTGLMKPEGLACDWIGKKLYWTDSQTKRIEVSELSSDSFRRRVLIWQGLDQPRAIAVAPSQGLMFWSDWGLYPKIERAGMDGSDRKVLVTEDLGWPNGITLDFENRLLYFAEAKWHYISSVDWDGNRQQAFYYDKDDMPLPFAISFHAGSLFWTDWETNSLHTINTSLWSENQKSIFEIKVRGKLTPMDIKVFEPSRQTSPPESSFRCLQNNGGCSHLCLPKPTEPFFSCSCPSGVKLLTDKLNCAENFDQILLMAKRDEIIKISLDTPDFTDLIIPLGTNSSPSIRSIAIDYDPKDKKVYWTDELLGIHRTTLDGHGVEDVIVKNVDHPDGIAVDWLTRNVYWSDTGTDRIEVASIATDKYSRRVIVSVDLDEPRGIALDPVRGWMYWSDWGVNPKIEKAWMDGTHRKMLISENIVWPNGISLDVEEQKLYWCDAKMDTIEVANAFDGLERRTIVSTILHHPFGLTVLDEYIYWTDWKEKTLERALKDSGEEREVLVSHLKGMMGLKASSVIPTSEWTNGCVENNGGCSHLCINTPKGIVCECPNDYELSGDLSTCEKPDAFLLYTRKKNIGRASLKYPERNGYALPLRNIRHASGLDYNSRKLYWSDVEEKKISSSYLNGSSQETLVEFGLDFPYGLAVDWISGNIYWTDMGLNRIEVYSKNSGLRRCIIWKNLDSPVSVALDPEKGSMYWSAWGKFPKIETAFLDGKSRRVFIEGIGRSYGLTLDFHTDRLYWTDLDDASIFYTSLNKLRLERVISNLVQQPYGLTIFGTSLFWSDWKLRTLEKANKESGDNRTVLQNNLDGVMDLLVIHDERRNGSNSCSNTVECKDICLYGDGVLSCVCPSQFIRNPSTGKCSRPNSFVILAKKNKMDRILIDSDIIPDVTLSIKGAKSINSMVYNSAEESVYWIDRGGRKKVGSSRTHPIVVIKKAPDNNGTVSGKIWKSFEGYNPYDLALDPLNELLYWSCEKFNAINVTRLDGENIGSVLGSRIGDRPRKLGFHSKYGILFWVNSGSPVRIERSKGNGQMRKTIVNLDLEVITDFKVDEIDDLLFWADTSLSKIFSTDLNGLNRKVIADLPRNQEPVYLAVHRNYLLWGSSSRNLVYVDKKTGLEPKVLKSEIKRFTGLISGSLDSQNYIDHPCSKLKCAHICVIDDNGLGACSCTSGMTLRPDGVSCGVPTCGSDKFACVSGDKKCIPIQWRCDGQPECSDHSDEIDCPECGPNQFRCQNGQCIDGIQLCDKTNHCSDNSDELRCCPGDEFQCLLSRECVPQNLTCNGISDCDDNSDEKIPQCSQNSESLKEFILDSTGLKRPSGPTNTSTYLIAIFVGLISILISGLSVYYCKRKSYISGNSNKSSLENKSEDSTDPLEEPVKVFPPPPPPPSVSCGPAATETPSYDRNQITGCSSSSSSRLTKDPLFHHRRNCSYAGPHPSPATSVVFQSGLRAGDYYPPPPPTPCSTDINEEESDIYTVIRPHFPSEANSVYDSDTNGLLYPRLSPPPSPERSFFGVPGGPPPSPVQFEDNS